MSDGLNDYVPMHAHDVGGGKAMNEVKEGQQRGWKVCCKDTRVYFDRKILCMVLDCPHGHQELGGLGLASASPSVTSEAEQHRNECEQCNRSMVGENAVCLTCWNHAAALAAPSQREALPAEPRLIDIFFAHEPVTNDDLLVGCLCEQLQVDMHGDPWEQWREHLRAALAGGGGAGK